MALPPPRFPQAPWRLRPTAPLCLSLVLVVLGGAVYANCFQGKFVFDDMIWVNGVGGVKCLNQPSQWLWSQSEAPTHGRPLAALSLALNYAWGRESTTGYHAFNLTVHLLCAVAFFAVLRRLLQQPPLRASWSESATPIAFAAALLWMVHPLQSECVNYISQRTESMVSLCFLCAFYSAIRAREGGRWWIIAATLSCWVGVGCKEIIATAPILVVLSDFAFRDQAWKATWRSRWPLWAAMASSWLPLAALMWLQPRAFTVGSSEDFPTIQYFLNQCEIIVHYLGLAVWPNALALDYGQPFAVSLQTAVPCLLLLTALFLGSVMTLFTRPAIGFAGLWFFIILAPTSSVIPIITEVGAERRVYLPLMSLIAVATAIAYRLVQLATARLSKRAAASTSARACLTGAFLFLLLAVAAPLAARTVQRNRDYRDPIRLWWQSLKAHPHNARAAYNLAVRFTRDSRHAEAIGAYRRLLERWPNYAHAHNNLGIHYRTVGMNEDALRHYERAAELLPTWPPPQKNLVYLLAACPDPKFRDGRRALRIAQEMCRRQPREPLYHEALAAAHAECGDFDAAVAEIRLARRLVNESDAYPPEMDEMLERRLRRYLGRKPLRME